MLKKRRVISFLAALFMLLCICLSALYIIIESEHECTGDNCQICINIDTCANAFKNTTPEPDVNAVIVIALFSLVLTLGAKKQRLLSETLISLKVKLSN